MKLEKKTFDNFVPSVYHIITNLLHSFSACSSDFLSMSGRPPGVGQRPLSVGSGPSGIGERPGSVSPGGLGGGEGRDHGHQQEHGLGEREHQDQ